MGAFERLIGKYIGSENKGYLLVLNSNGTAFQMQVKGEAASGNTKTKPDVWFHVVGTYRGNVKTIYVNGKYDGVDTDSGALENASEPLYLGRQSIANRFLHGILDEARIRSVASSPDWIAAEYKSETNNYLTFGDEELFGSELVSSIFDAGKGMSWGYLSYDTDEPGKTAARVKVRTGNNMYLADAPDFETCDSITNKSDISNNNCVTDSHRYIQYQVILDTTEAAKTPIFKSISITDFLPSKTHPVVKGISTVASPSPSPNTSYIILNTFPSPAPTPSPSLTPNHYPLNTIFDFLNALFH